MVVCSTLAPAGVGGWSLEFLDFFFPWSLDYAGFLDTGVCSLTNFLCTMYGCCRRMSS